MRVEMLVWVCGRAAIVGSFAWLLIACDSQSNTYVPPPGSDAGPVPCTVVSASTPACTLIVEPIAIDAGDGGDNDAAVESDAGISDASIYSGDGSCPLATASEVQCYGITRSDLSVAANSNGEAYAAIVTPLASSTGYGSQLVDLKADGSGTTDLEPVPRAQDLRARVVTNADGSPGIVAERTGSDLRYFTRAGNMWSGDVIPGAVNDDLSLEGAASSRDGNVYALVASDVSHATLDSRASSGGWSSGTSLAVDTVNATGLAVDADGLPYMIGWGTDGASFVLVAGNASPVTFGGPSSYENGLTVAIAGASGKPKSPMVFLPGGNALLALYALGSPNKNRSIGGATSSTCSAFTLGFTCDDCQVGAQCDSYSDQIGAFAAATTDDGTVWLAYLATSVDTQSVVELHNDPILPLGCACDTSTQSTTAQSAALVVEPLGASGQDTGISMRFPLSTSSDAVGVALAANGAKLHVFVNEISKIDHTVIDTSKIPKRPF